MARWHLWRSGHPAWRWWLMALVVALAVAVAVRTVVILGREEPPGVVSKEGAAP